MVIREDVSRMRVAQMTVRATTPRASSYLVSSRFRAVASTIQAARHMARYHLLSPRTEMSELNRLRHILMGSEFRFEMPPEVDEKILQIMDEFYERQSKALLYTNDKCRWKKR